MAANSSHLSVSLSLWHRRQPPELPERLTDASNQISQINWIDLSNAPDRKAVEISIIINDQPALRASLQVVVQAGRIAHWPDIDL